MYSNAKIKYESLWNYLFNATIRLSCVNTFFNFPSYPSPLCSPSTFIVFIHVSSLPIPVLTCSFPIPVFTFSFPIPVLTCSFHILVLTCSFPTPVLTCSFPTPVLTCFFSRFDPTLRFPSHLKKFMAHILCFPLIRQSTYGH